MRGFTAEELHDYDIGVTDEPPSSQTPSPVNYDLCHHVVGGAQSVATITCNPVVSGRYVVIQIAGSSEILTLCEVVVYGTEGKTSNCKNDSSDPRMSLFNDVFDHGILHPVFNIYLTQMLYL